VTQPEHNHDADGTGDVAGATWGTALVAAGISTSVEDEADPFGRDIEH